MSQAPMPGPTRRSPQERSEQGNAINSAWDYVGQLMNSPWVQRRLQQQEMGTEYMLRSMAMRPQMERQSYYDRREEMKRQRRREDTEDRRSRIRFGDERRAARRESQMAPYEDMARLKQIQAMTEPPPTRTVTGPGVVPGPTMDVMRMNAFQRQAYLPQESRLALPPSDLPSSLDYRSGMSPLELQYPTARMWATMVNRR